MTDNENPDVGPLFGPDTVDRLAALLDGAGELTEELARADFPEWRIWHSAVTGCWHATRRCEPTGRFREVHGDPRRFHQAASTLGRLVMLLLAQTAVDAESTEDS